MFSLMQLFQHMYMASALFNYYGNRVPDYVSNAYFNNNDTLYNTIAYSSVPTSNPSSCPKQTYYNYDNYHGGLEGLSNQSSYNLSFQLVIPSIDYVTDNYAFGTDFDYVFCLKYLENDYFQLSGSQTLYNCQFITDNYWLEPIYQNYFSRTDNDLLKIGYDQSQMQWTFAHTPINFSHITTTDKIYYINIQYWSPDSAIFNSLYGSFDTYSMGSLSRLRLDATSWWVIKFTFYYEGWSNQTGVGTWNEWENGHAVGYQEGYEQGLNDGSTNNLFTLFGYVLDTPILYLRKLFDYEILGVNLFGFMCGLMSLALVLWVVRRLI